MKTEKPLTPYYMISQDIEVLRKNFNGKIVKLCSNESPLGANPNVAKAAKNILYKIYQYPDSESTALKKVLTKYLEIDEDMIIFGNGSTELIDLITQEIFSCIGNAVISEYSYPLYEMLVEKYKGTIKIVPMSNWGFDLTAFSNTVDDKTKAIYIANPNNPTNSWVSSKEILTFLDKVPKEVIVIIDEAYGEYLDDIPGYDSSIKLIRQHPNLVVTRTFSKVYGLAGLRVGYLTANPRLIQKIRIRKQSTNVNLLGQTVAITAYQDLDYKSRVIKEVRNALKLITEELSQMGIEYVSSHANFVLVKTPMPSFQAYKDFLNYGIIVQPMDFYKLPNFIRISMGQIKDMLYLISVLPKVFRNEH